MDHGSLSRYRIAVLAVIAGLLLLALAAAIKGLAWIALIAAAAIAVSIYLRRRRDTSDRLPERQRR